MSVEDVVLRELHRASISARRRRISIPSIDLDTIAERIGSRQSAAQALDRLTRSGRVLRVRRDLIVLAETIGLIDVELADLVAAVAGPVHLITAGAALEHADLTDQHFFGIAVLVTTEISPIRFRSNTGRFFTTDPTAIWGAEPGTGPRYATVERALVDAITHPRYGVSLTLVLDAMIRASDRDRAFLDRLHDTVARYGAGSRAHGCRATARRVGLLVERLVGADAAAPYQELIGANRTPVPLRPGGVRSGPIDRRWRVQINTPIDAPWVA